VSQEYEFYAFISYKRGEEDEKWARRLQRELERYRIPVADLLQPQKTDASVFPRETSAEPVNPPGRINELLPPELELRTGIPQRLRIFRDKSDLGSHSTVEQGLSENLDASRFLVVVCSRRSAESPYVDAEVRHFVESGRGGNIIPFFIEDSEPERSRGSRKFPRPPSLPAEMEGVAASEGDEESFIHLLARLLRVEQESLMQAHLRASRRRATYRFCAVAASVILIAGLGLWTLAAESRATVWREESEELVDFLTFDLVREITPWLPSRKLASVSDRVQEYYERWEPREPRAVFARVVNLNQRGSAAEHIEENREGAIELVMQALDLLEILRGREPYNESFFVEYSQTLLKAGGLFEKDDRLEKAGILYQKSLDAARAFSEDHPNSLRGTAQVADSLQSLAKLAAARRSFEEANALYRECERTWNVMLRRWPEEAKTWLWRMRYGDFLSGRGYVELLQNNYAGAADYVGAALEIFENFYEEDPKNLMIRLFYADELRAAAFMAAKLRALEAGEVFYSVGEDIWRELVAEDPQPGYVYGWAVILTTGGLLRFQQERLSEAEKLLDEAEEIVDALIRLNPDNDAYLAQKSSIEEYRESMRRKTGTAPSGKLANPRFPQARCREESSS
jgi:tetratricopeptide (TPR) repeat protein